MSTQILTELPNIQKTGMDFNSVVREIQKIISDNPKWKENWPEFYDSEAGVMLTDIMAWIADNLSTRQDVLFNEMFIGTAQKDADKIKHLKHIGYIPQMPHSSRTMVSITLDRIAQKDIVISPVRTGDLSERVSQLASFTGKDINGKDVFWEILKMKNDKPDYLASIVLPSGDLLYRNDKNFDTLYAYQGRTNYEEFTSVSKNGNFFNLGEKNIASGSIQVYIKSSVEQLMQVNSFFSKEALNKDLPIPYVLELNEDLTYRIRFADEGLLDEDRLLPADTTISVFYRTCNGSDGNIRPFFLNTTTNYNDVGGNSYDAIINNEYPGNGGSDQETLDQAVLNGPISLRTMDRAVTPEDYNMILERNTSIFKAKTYTASNQPAGFKNYYGRYINPQESFSFVMLNKNYENVPTSKYNSFPWITLTKEPRLNEKYIFDDAKYNGDVSLGQTYYNLKLQEPGKDEISFNNATIFELGNEFNDALYDGQLENEFLKLKLSVDKTEEEYFSRIPFSIFDDKSIYVELGMGLNSSGKPNNYVSVDDNARFLTKQEVDLSVPIDVKKAQYLNVIINDELSVRIDFWQQFNDPKNMRHAYLKWDNISGDSDQYKENDTIDAANHRNGIIQIINKSINDAAANADDKFSYAINNISRQYFGLEFNSINDNLPQQFDKFSLKINGDVYIFNNVETKNYLDLKTYLNNSFLGTNNNVQKIVDGVPVEIKTELIGYQAEIIKLQDKTTYDLCISNDKGMETLLTDKEIEDKNGFKHILKNVVDIEDPDKYTAVDGLFKILNPSKVPPYPTQATEYKDLAKIRRYGEDKENKGRLEIKSPTIGYMSNIYFKKEISSNTDFGSEILKVFYDTDLKSYKAYGVKKAYMLKDNPISISAVNNYNIDGKRGNIIFENSCIYTEPDFEKVFCNYKLRENNSLVLGSVYDNFYYMGNEKDDLLKSSVYGLEGQYMVHNISKDGKRTYKIDPDRCKFNIKFTKEKKDTNSIFAIDTDLNIIQSDNVRLETAEIKNENINGKLEFSIDNSENIVIDIKNGLNGSSIAAKIKQEIKGKGDEFISLKNNIDTVISNSYESINTIIFKSIKNQNGSIKFYKNEDTLNSFYKVFFGTNKTNENLYTLYPKDLFEDINIKYVDAEDKTEYYYAPTTDYPIEFKFREIRYNEENFPVSREPDYYINVDETIENQIVKYKFILKKTENSLFPDSYFYVHFINDKSYDININDKETDESILQDYMRNYIISGSEISFLQPYFKTYDISANIKYNNNFSENEVRENVKRAIDKVCDLKYAKIAGSMSRAKILKAIMNCEGVEDCRINYFGYDFAKGDDNSEELVADFYQILCIHEDDKVTNMHGKILTFEEVDSITLDTDD